MKILKEASQDEVLRHWEIVEASDGGFSNKRRGPILDPLAELKDLKWYEAIVEKDDVGSIFIISSPDWVYQGNFCIPDFKLTTAATNYKTGRAGGAKFGRIKGAEQMFLNDMASLDTKFLLVADNTSGPYTIIEGNKRSVALTAMGRIVGIQVYLGISPGIRSWDLARCSYW